MNNISTLLTPALAMYLIGLLYRNTRTSCVSLALLCAQVSHDTLRRVLYSKVPWSRRLGKSFAHGLYRASLQSSFNGCYLVWFQRLRTGERTLQAW
jgi:hypothetical protein